MRKIPDALRENMAKDPFYKKCCLSSIPNTLGKIEWHHNFIYAGKQVNEKWCILPLEAALHTKANETWIKELLDWVMLNRAADEELMHYSKAINLIKKREQLNKIYGVYKENNIIL